VPLEGGREDSSSRSCGAWVIRGTLVNAALKGLLGAGVLVPELHCFVKGKEELP
jgi:hypothetical protein